MSKGLHDALNSLGEFGTKRNGILYIPLGLEQIILLIAALERLTQTSRTTLTISTLRDMLADPHIISQSWNKDRTAGVVLYADCLRLDQVATLIETKEYDVLETETTHDSTGHP